MLHFKVEWAMSNKSYHDYVFNQSKRKFVGQFDEMYENEIIDPWCSSNLTDLAKQIHSVVLNQTNWNTILDYGCGKGVFTHTLRKNNNKVVGVDISQNAIDKAIQVYGHLVDFYCINHGGAPQWQKLKYDLIVCLEVLSYVESYKDKLKEFANMSSYLYLSLYVPKDPIGFVKSIDELVQSIKQYYKIENKIIFNDESVFIFAKSKIR